MAVALCVLSPCSNSHATTFISPWNSWAVEQYELENAQCKDAIKMVQVIEVNRAAINKVMSSNDIEPAQTKVFSVQLEEDAVKLWFRSNCKVT